MRDFFRRWGADLCELDLRSLACFRICLALTLLYDLADRGRSLTAHYTDQGVLPARQAIEVFGGEVRFAVHAWVSGSPVATGAVFVVAAALAVALLLGYRTRVVTILCWYLLVSLQVRNGYLSSLGGDRYLRLLLFWAIFLPLGARASLDARRRPSVPPPATALGANTAALLVQLVVIYVVTGFEKNGAMWRDGSAVYYALSLRQYETVFTGWLRAQDALLPLLTWGTRGVELFGPLLLLVPVYTAPARLVAVALFTGFHLGLALFLNIGPFPIMAIVGWTAFLPGAFWDRAARLLGRTPAPGSGRARTPPALQVAAGLALAYVLVQQALVEGIVGPRGGQMPYPVKYVGDALRLNQTWWMFAPNPSVVSIWLGVEGELADGRTVDPYRRLDDPYAQPARISDDSRGFRWRFYTWNALLTKPDSAHFASAHESFARYLCREWNASHRGGERLVRLTTLAFTATTGPEGIESHRPLRIHTQTCDDPS